MADEETRVIEALIGPFRNSIISVPASVADQAIKDGWARDPHNPFAKRGEVDHEKALAAAEKAARKIRGEDAPKKEKEENKSFTAKEPSSSEGYETRSTETRGPGRPPKT